MAVLVRKQGHKSRAEIIPQNHQTPRVICLFQTGVDVSFRRR